MMRALPLAGSPPPATSKPAPWSAKGFRPFFLLAGLFATALLPTWLLALAGAVDPGAYFDPIGWHAHEMVFGLTGAVVAGFLLTAVSNWTGRETATGPSLMLLAVLWIAARITLVVPHLPRVVPAMLDLAFFPAIILAIGRPIIATQSLRNYPIVAVVAALFAANATTHASIVGVLPGWGRHGALLGVDLLVLLIVVITGRVLPMFTRNATGAASVRSHPQLDQLAIVAAAAVVLIDIAAPDGAVAAILAALASIATAARAVHWTTLRVWRVPLLWVLHLGHGWVSIGLALRAIAFATGAIPPSLATHALTVGAIGTLVLGMMARVSLGHTGRPLVVGRAVTTSFALVTSAAAARVGGPLLDGSLYRATLYVAGAAWTGAFAIFVAAYARVLVSPRPDGKAG